MQAWGTLEKLEKLEKPKYTTNRQVVTHWPVIPVIPVIPRSQPSALASLCI
jgi:hypothetical protein